jgi:hypothetical protein
MRRRDLIGAAGLAAWPGQAESGEIRTDVVRLKLRHTWTTVMSSSDYRTTCTCNSSATGHRLREAAPIARYKENAGSARSGGASCGPAPFRDPGILETSGEVFRRIEDSTPPPRSTSP